MDVDKVINYYERIQDASNTLTMHSSYVSKCVTNLLVVIKDQEGVVGPLDYRLAADKLACAISSLGEALSAFAKLAEEDVNGI